jgi:hypothetical protein
MEEKAEPKDKNYYREARRELKSRLEMIESLEKDIKP